MYKAHRWLTLLPNQIFGDVMNMLPETSTASATRFAVVFDFDKDSCYPSSAIDANANVNGGMSVEEADSSYTSGCREQIQLTNSNTYHRQAVIERDGHTYSVHMYALYFMKDKDLPTRQPADISGHRHDWEFALVWTIDNKVTHGSFSHHGEVTTEPLDKLYTDTNRPETVKVVYHKNFLTTHSMRFAKQDEKDQPAENHSGKWLTPAIVDWYKLDSKVRNMLNIWEFGEADCSVTDKNFGNEIGKNPPDGYPSGDDWKDAALIEPPVFRFPLDELKHPPIRPSQFAKEVMTSAVPPVDANPQNEVSRQSSSSAPAPATNPVQYAKRKLFRPPKS